MRADSLASKAPIPEARKMDGMDIVRTIKENLRSKATTEDPGVMMDLGVKYGERRQNLRRERT